MHEAIGPTHPPYRADIDGLRAIAVLAVIFFHAGFPWARGGYIGVDVFFVISGFLITGILRREHEQGAFSLARFYERRARRILPALLMVLAATLLACAVVMLPDDRRVVARSAVGVVAFAANIIFWRGVDFGDVATVNYFGRRVHNQPLVHTWSLGVEEQFYLLFPLGLLLLWRWRVTLVVPVLVATAAASLILSAWLTPRSPGAAFYLLPTRGWELLAGGLVAWSGSRESPRRSHPAAAALGLIAIIATTWWYDETTPFPGVHAVVPVLGTVGLLRYAPGSAIGAMLSWRPLVFVGLISYSAYLWHQPLFSLARYVKLSGALSVVETVLLCATTLLLAAATWRWIETPFRDRRRMRAGTLAWSCGLATAGVGIASALWAFDGTAGRRSPRAAGPAGQSVLSLFSDCNAVLQFTRRLGPGCLLDPASAAPPSFLVLGDSHANALFPAFAQISREGRRQGRLLQHIACMPLLDVTSVPSDTLTCQAMQQVALDLVARERIGSVFLIGRFHLRDSLAPRFDKTIAAYAERGAAVYLVAQVPEQPRFDARPFARALLLQRFGVGDAAAVARSQSVTRAGHDSQQAAVNALFAAYRGDPRVTIVDVTSALCDSQTCAAGSAEGPYYVDNHHLNTAGALAVSGALAQQAGLVRDSRNLALPIRRETP